MNIIFTLDLRLYCFILTNGIRAIVKSVPHINPANIPVKFNCHGNVPKRKKATHIRINFNRATCGRCKRFQ